ncbi:MAG: hypothetical protein ACLFTG_06210 [Alphaproteobacteria bacterium]
MEEGAHAGLGQPRAVGIHDVLDLGGVDGGLELLERAAELGAGLLEGEETADETSRLSGP